MRLDILTSTDQAKVKIYVTKKFTKYKSWTYSKAKRRKKCRAYYDAASPTHQRTINNVYFLIFKEVMPESDGLAASAARRPDPVMVSADDWRESQEARLAKSRLVLTTLREWKESAEHQMGDDFFLRLKALIADYDPSLCDRSEFRAENEGRVLAQLTGGVTRTADEVNAQFEGMIGVKQTAGMTFEAYSGRWGEISAKLEEEFKAGVWGRGGAQAKLSRLGFSAEVQLAIAMGIELNIAGECTWKKGDLGLALGGACNAFGGARGEISAKLSANALKGLEASIKAGAFAGFALTASGSCAFTYRGDELVKVEAEASILFGVGAEFEASLKAPIFGPTRIKVAGELTLGVGAGTSFAFAVNFTKIGLAGSSQFRKLIYLPTIIRGYEMTLMDGDRRNHHYLMKCEQRMGDHAEEIEERLTAYHKVPMDKRRLLMELDD